MKNLITISLLFAFVSCITCDFVIQVFGEYSNGVVSLLDQEDDMDISEKDDADEKEAHLVDDFMFTYFQSELNCDISYYIYLHTKDYNNMFTPPPEVRI